MKYVLLLFVLLLVGCATETVTLTGDSTDPDVQAVEPTVVKEERLADPLEVEEETVIVVDETEADQVQEVAAEPEPTVTAKVGNQIGDLAPDVRIATVDNTVLQVADLTAEKPTVLYFFATWCPHCSKDLDAVDEIIDEYKDDLNFVAIGIDTRESAEKISTYRSNKGLSDIDFAPADRDILSAYGVTLTTAKYFINADGIIDHKGVGELTVAGWRQSFDALIQ